MKHLTLAVVWVIQATLFSESAKADQVESSDSCGLNTPATELGRLIKQHPSQQRPELQCNQLLTSIAQQRAEQLANNSADPDITANQILIKGGFRVPNYYPVSGNQVEAVAKGFKQAEQAFQYLMQSTKHHDHVLGKGEFFSLQSQLGIGFFAAQEATQHDQWVVLIAEPWQSAKFVYKQEFNMPVKMAKGCDKDWKNSGDEFLIRKCRSMSQAKRIQENREEKRQAKEATLECDATSCEKQ